jgi:hypothetical protein
MGGQSAGALVIVAREIAPPWALDLDDPGTQVSQLTGAKGRSDRMFQRYDGDAIKGALAAGGRSWGECVRVHPRILSPGGAHENGPPP